ncbi:ATP-binding cassette domain-containing protein [Metallosphaera hakonensis JCM 8857 = DSM 7519]|uniref:Nitrate/sulfonate/bicarbonate ABC transporter ATP-binding protein n=1 Tax=Metallosphaera hakonensis JCM 8857 = DSM 7519 TaxID=1293036 RepID=A0A2U9IWG0_9CREN|nr:ABC transporter ATP-binding protein [Metallosphaera hakonensis]AWS00238.1 ATP-binding cassette domain-containing protein [Metallosphaera hakonensis JCM 8857 = DSM 7519]
MNLVFQYSNNYRVFEHVTLKTEENQLTAIVGPSGVGKSTLLRILGGFVKPTEGEVRLMGKKVTHPTPRIALIHQSIATFPWLTALENVKLGIKYRKLTREEEDKIARKMLEVVGLQGFEDFYPKQMSGGMRQRVAIARALAADPYVLLMDEPFAHLDELTAEGLRQEIYSTIFNEETSLKTAVMVSHNMNEVVELSDKVYVLNGSPATVVGEVIIDLERPRNPKDQKFQEYLDVLYKLLTPIKKKVKE